MKTIHPFPARMAPEIALDSLAKLSKRAVVLDPMMGSGTVLRQAVLNGHKAIGFDMDPLAVLMSKTWTEPVNFEILDGLYQYLLGKAKTLDARSISLRWQDEETHEFIKYWFGLKQRKIIKCIAYVLYHSQKLKKHPNEANVLRVALSRLIITKKYGASLAWDVSHSRPHKVMTKNSYDVWAGYGRSFKRLRDVLSEHKITGKSSVGLGDARKMDSLKRESVDVVITSPPYLNAIDYLRGHKLALVWLGYRIDQVRNIRGQSIGAEKAMTDVSLQKEIARINKKLRVDTLPGRHLRMIERYTFDACLLMKEISRLLKPDGRAIFVVGNSCLKNVYIENSKIFHEAGKLYGLRLRKKSSRDLPAGSRYLPLPKDSSSALGKRMKTEVILEFVRS